VGEAEHWVVATLSGPAAELDRFGNAPVEGDLDVIQDMTQRLGIRLLDLDAHRRRAREPTMTGAEIGALLSGISPPATLWVR
jgi:hypothetical protein